MKDNSKILPPCPFCKSKNVIMSKVEYHYLPDDYQVLCQNPRCKAGGPVRRTPKGAAKTWAIQPTAKTDIQSMIGS